MECFDAFETSRLTAEGLRADHFDTLHPMHRDPRVMATLGGPRDAAKTRRFLRRNLGQWTRRGYGIWMFHAHGDGAFGDGAFGDGAFGDGAFVGRAGLRHLKIDGVREIELAYALRAETWGRGLATEMAEAILEIAFRDLALADLVCFTQPTNPASRRVMEKVGFRYERDFVYAGLPHRLCRQSAGQWRARRRGRREGGSNA